MAITSQPRSRRALLGASLCAVAATVATAIGRPGLVRGQAPPVELGVDNQAATTTTGIVNNTNANTTLHAASSNGIAVYGYGSAGVGVEAQSDTGYAIHAIGRLSFTTSGIATIAAGHTSKSVYTGSDVTAQSFVLLTPSVDIGTRRLWFTRDIANDLIVIHMSSSRSSATPISYLMLG